VSKALQFQDPGEGIHEAEVVDVLVSVGDTVDEGQNVLVVETDKADFEVHAPFGGTVQEIHVSEGDVIRVGDTLATLGDGASDASDADEGDASDADEGDASDADEGDGAPAEEASGADGSEESDEAQERPRKPRDAKDDGSRKRRGDGAPDWDEGPIPAAPATRRVARELGVELGEVAPSGEGGRVLTEDVRAHAAGGADRETAERKGREAESADSEGGKALTREEAPAAEPLPDFERFGPVERRPLRSVRRTIARRMARSWREIPHVTHNDLADVTELEAFRRRHAASVAERGGKLTLTVFVMKALAGVLSEHPRFNASLDTEAEELVLKRHCHLGVAFDTERGLLVPVVRDVDRKSLTDLAVELRELGERTRAGELSREDMQGGTFTLSNVGPLGGTYFTPIINHPEVAILGLGRATLQPVVRGTLDAPQIEPRLQLPLSLGFDHRVNDGADAARLTNDLVRVLGDLEAFALSI